MKQGLKNAPAAQSQNGKSGKHRLIDFRPCPPISREAGFCLIAEAPMFRLGLRDAGQTIRGRENRRSLVNQKEALTFVERHGIVLQAGRGPVANLAEAIAGAPSEAAGGATQKGKRFFALPRRFARVPTSSFVS